MSKFISQVAFPDPVVICSQLLYHSHLLIQGPSSLWNACRNLFLSFVKNAHVIASVCFIISQVVANLLVIFYTRWVLSMQPAAQLQPSLLISACSSPRCILSLPNSSRFPNVSMLTCVPAVNICHLITIVPEINHKISCQLADILHWMHWLPEPKNFIPHNAACFVRFSVHIVYN